jgi:hypothetical protein
MGRKFNDLLYGVMINACLKSCPNFRGQIRESFASNKGARNNSTTWKSKTDVPISYFVVRNGWYKNGNFGDMSIEHIPRKFYEDLNEKHF